MPITVYSPHLYGSLNLTAGVDQRMREDEVFASFVKDCIVRFYKQDWGELDEEDKSQNEMAIAEAPGATIFAIYYMDPEIKSDSIYIICNGFCADENRARLQGFHPYTTVLFPSEY